MDIVSLLSGLLERLLELLLHLPLLLTKSRDHGINLSKLALLDCKSNLACYFLNSSRWQINVHSLQTELLPVLLSAKNSLRYLFSVSLVASVVLQLYMQVQGAFGTVEFLAFGV